MTLAQYTRNVEDLNDDKKFPREFLEAIYTEVRDDEIKIHAEHARRGTLSAVTWRHLRANDTLPALTPPSRALQHAADTLLYDTLFAALHRALRAAACADAAQLERALALAQISALVAAQVAHTRALDDLCLTLAHVTALIPQPPSPAPSAATGVVSSAAQWGSSERAMYAAIALFTLSRKHGEHIQEAWAPMVACVATLADLGLIPATLFALEDPFTLLEDDRAEREARQTTPTTSSSSSSWFSWLSGGGSSASSSGGDAEAAVAATSMQAEAGDPVTRRFVEVRCVVLCV